MNSHNLVPESLGLDNVVTLFTIIIIVCSEGNRAMDRKYGLGSKTAIGGLLGAGAGLVLYLLSAGSVPS